MIAVMTKLLKEALAKVSKLPANQQDALAAILLEEFADEERWTEAFKGSQAALEKLAGEALEDFERGRTTPLELGEE